LTRKEQKENMKHRRRSRLVASRESLAMSEPALQPPPDRYEQACDQAIAMCNGSTRGAIKALIMANEYLETELQQLQAAVSKGFGRGRPGHEPAPGTEAISRSRLDWYD